MTPRRTTGLAAGLLLAAAAVAQEPKAEPSTAQPGQKVPDTFRAFLVADDRFPPKVSPPTKAEDRDPRDRTRKMHDLVGENGLSPVVAVFVRADPKELGDSGVVKLAKAVDKIVPKYRADRLAGFVQFLRIEGAAKSVTLTNPDGTTKVVELDAEFPDDEKRDLHAADVFQLAKSAAAPNVPVGLAPVTSRSATAWGLKAEDAVTVVIYNRLRVEGRWVFPAAGPTDGQVAEIIKATEAMIDGPIK
ncbi:MAG TPA: hypothetical protein VH092_38020 [Urbifossiella sp.]|jgi:hypothetical protein|nr:hypothetical protein [Urbifossiella sp.]